MSDDKVVQAKCLCGSVTLAVKNVGEKVGACHCAMCRKWGGGPLLAVDCGLEVSIAGKEQLAVFNSSDWSERGFCKQCGTHLFYRLKQSGQTIIPAGLFEDDSKFAFDHQVFIDEKPSYYGFANNTSTMTGAEVFAKFAPPSQ